MSGLPTPFSTPEPPELDFCSRCGEHAEWALDQDRWYSLCCGAAPIAVDVEPDQLLDLPNLGEAEDW